MTVPVFVAVISALASVVLLAAGFAAGWVLSPKSVNYTPVSLEKPTKKDMEEMERKRKEWERQQEAFKDIQCYDAQHAYGIPPDAE